MVNGCGELLGRRVSYEEVRVPPLLVGGAAKARAPDAHARWWEGWSFAR